MSTYNTHSSEAKIQAVNDFPKGIYEVKKEWRIGEQGEYIRIWLMLEQGDKIRFTDLEL